MARTALVAVVVLFLISRPALSAVPSCSNPVSNPLEGKPCRCSEQIFVQSDCTEVFWCSDGDANVGCYTQCNPDEIPQVDFVLGTVTCAKRSDIPTFKCPGPIEINCEDEDVGQDFSSEKNCQECQAGGFTMRRDCREAFICFPLFPLGGRHIQCGDGYIIDVNIYDLSYECIPDNGQCPGLGGYTLGCPDPDVVPTLTPGNNETENPLGTCGCPGQFFSSDDCLTAFWCDDGPDWESNLGTIQECKDGQIIRPNFAEGRVQCVNKVTEQCPGAFNVNCLEDDVGDDFHEGRCNCEGQVWVNKDCSKGFYCYDNIPGGGVSLECGQGEVINIDIANFDWGCVQNVGQCPEMGGFTIGCRGGSEVTPGLPQSSTAEPPMPTTAGAARDTAILYSLLIAVLLGVVSLQK